MRTPRVFGLLPLLILVGLMVAGCGRLRFEVLGAPAEGEDAGVEPPGGDGGPLGPCDATQVGPVPAVCTGGGACPLLATKVQASLTHACAVGVDGRLWCWGTNCHGQLGQGDRLTRLSPVEVELEGPVRDVGVGPGFTCSVTEAGEVHCWGRNDRGTLGLGDTRERLVPAEPVPGGQSWRLVSAGVHHVCAIDSVGELWCWGSNGEGQLAQPDPYPEPGFDRLEPIRVSDERWRAVTTEEAHTCGIRTDGTIWCTGRNIRGQLGAGADEPGQVRGFLQAGSAASWASLEGSPEATCAIREDGTLWCWGTGYMGSLGFGDGDTRWEPVQRTDGPTWRAVSVGRFHGCGAHGDGTLWCWGRAIEGQLGFARTEPQLEPVQPPRFTASVRSLDVGVFTSFVVTDDSTVWATGTNEGVLGNGETDRPYAFTQVMLP